MSSENQSNELPTGADHARRIASDMPVSNEARDTAAEYARKYGDEVAAVTNTPRVIGAAAVYATCVLVNEKQTQEEVSEAADVSTPAIRDAFHAMAEHDDVVWAFQVDRDVRGKPRPGYTRRFLGWLR